MYILNLTFPNNLAGGLMPESREYNKLLFVIVNRPEALQDFIKVLVEVGIQGATVIDSMGMGRILAHDIPIFAGLRSLITGARPQNKTVLILLHEEMIPLVVEAFEVTVGPLDHRGNGMMFSLSAEMVRSERSQPEKP
ncbi:MAG: hypothetical protein C4524_09415 [Candidatus Zixiibacteriota bacterium]|nr:MAG: hypothetical protein C4524_09415 [candidate division Zixibacteria bacterium]